jgi:putative membrane protein
MIFFLILGALLGAVSIIFVLQNIIPVTVSFFSLQLNASLALVLFLAMLAGVVINILVLLPGFIRDEFRVSRLRRKNKDLESELEEARITPVYAPRHEEHELPTTMPVSEHAVVL